MSPINKNQKSNERCKDYKQKKKLNDSSLGEKERIKLNAYGAKKKENQSEAEITLREKET